MKSLITIILVLGIGLINLSVKAQKANDVTSTVAVELCEKYDALICEANNVSGTLVLEVQFLQDYSFGTSKKIISDFFERFYDVTMHSYWEYDSEYKIYSCTYRLKPDIYIYISVSPKFQNKLIIFSLKI